ncbi:MAG: hypothetical protein JO349_01600 [Candidatus Eremiobacteraeota bacterium]|nr:hypothetical protein [Candidatus Eremiobacteraeota bacterium]
MDLVDRYLGEMERVLRAISRDEIRRAVAALFDAWRWRKTVWVVADGGILASYLADELHRMTVVSGQPSLHAARFVEQVSTLSAGDVVVALATTGDCENVLRAATRAKDVGALTLALRGLSGGALAGVADLSVMAPAERASQQDDAYTMIVHLIAGSLRERIELDAVTAANASAVGQ